MIVRSNTKRDNPTHQISSSTPGTNLQLIDDDDDDTVPTSSEEQAESSQPTPPRRYPLRTIRRRPARYSDD